MTVIVIPMKVVIDGVTYVPAEQQPAPSTMTEQEKAILQMVIDHKGTDYTFHSFSAFDHGAYLIRDERFHQLLTAFNHHRGEFMDYLRAQGIDV